MKLRPARATRKINSQAWARYSVKKPKKNYIKARPHTSLLIFKMGVKRDNYELQLSLNAKSDIQLRSNALESARQAANKYLEEFIPSNYYLRIIPFPHNVLREKRMATGAGADRISQGMTLSFGKAAAVAARVFEGDTVFELKTDAKNKEVAKIALRRAASHLSGTYKIVMSQIQTPKPVPVGEAA